MIPEALKESADRAANHLFELIACPVCSSSNLKSFFKVRYGELRQKKSLDYSCIGITQDTFIHVTKCKKCGFVFVNPRIRPAHQDAVYNECKKNMYINKPHLLEVGSEKYTVVSRKNKAAHIGPLLETLSHVNLNNTDLTLFDYGCGFGYSMCLARELGIRTYGVDIDRERLSVCETLGLEVSKPDEFDAKYPGVKADVILCQNNLEHLIDLRAAFNYLAAKSKPGTILYVNGLTPDIISIERRRGEYIKAHFIEHVNYFPVRTLDFFMAKFGYAPVDYTYISTITSIKDILKSAAAYCMFRMLGKNIFNGGFERIYKYTP